MEQVERTGRQNRQIEQIDRTDRQNIQIEQIDRTDRIGQDRIGQERQIDRKDRQIGKDRIGQDRKDRQIGQDRIGKIDRQERIGQDRKDRQMSIFVYIHPTAMFPAAEWKISLVNVPLWQSTRSQFPWHFLRAMPWGCPIAKLEPTRAISSLCNVMVLNTLR